MFVVQIETRNEKIITIAIAALVCAPAFSWGPRGAREKFRPPRQESDKGNPERTLVDWANENAAESYIIYDMAQEGDELFKPFYNPAWRIVQKQITRARYRLAKILNECFGKKDMESIVKYIDIVLDNAAKSE